MSWVTEDGCRYNNENPMVRDELWDDSDYGNDYDDEDYYKPPEGYTDISVRIHCDKLTDEEIVEFEKDMEILNTFEYPQNTEWNLREKIFYVNGWMSPEEEENFDEIWSEKYDLDCYEEWR